MRKDIQFIQQPALNGHSFSTRDIVRLTTANLPHEYQLDVMILRRDDKLIHGSVVVASPKIELSLAITWRR